MQSAGRLPSSVCGLFALLPVVCRGARAWPRSGGAQGRLCRWLLLPRGRARAHAVALLLLLLPPLRPCPPPRACVWVTEPSSASALGERCRVAPASHRSVLQPARPTLQGSLQAWRRAAVRLCSRQGGDAGRLAEVFSPCLQPAVTWLAHRGGKARRRQPQPSTRHYRRTRSLRGWLHWQAAAPSSAAAPVRHR